jgi:hypothetical protein
MKFEQRGFPPGPIEEYSSTEDLFRWMNENFVRYGDIYKASVFGSDVRRGQKPSLRYFGVYQSASS